MKSTEFSDPTFILEWAKIHFGAKLEWVNKVYCNNKEFVDDKNALWSLSWDYGVVGFDSFSKAEEEKAKIAASYFILSYLGNLCSNGMAKLVDLMPTDNLKDLIR